MQKKAGREIHFEGDVDGTEKKENNNIYSS